MMFAKQRLSSNEIFKQQLSKENNDLRPLDDEDIQNIQKVILDIVADMDGICRENDIPYSLGGGSALGALRHKGFIPWDDDIDINMESRYIEKFISCIEKKYPDKYILSIPGRTKGYYSTFIKVHKVGTVFREDLHTPDEVSGIKVDIFPFVNVYDNPCKRVLHGLLCFFGTAVLSCMRMRLYRDEYLTLAKDNPGAMRMIKMRSCLGMLPALAPDFFLRTVIKWYDACKDDHSRYVTCPSGRKHFAGEIRKRKGFEKTKRVPFDGMSLPVTGDIKGYMKQLYGDNYMELPPEEKREKHIIYELDLGEGS